MVNVSRETLDKLKAYERLLKKWQPKINLISNNTLDQAWGRHFEDSMQVEPLIPGNAKHLFDLGSGAGFPGMVLAIMRPDLDIHLVESDQKKCSFLRTVSRETNTSISIHNERIESVSCETVPDVVTARALASLIDLFSYCEMWIKNNTQIQLVFPKGERADEELALLSKDWQYDYCTHQSKTDPNAKILVFSNICKL